MWTDPSAILLIVASLKGYIRSSLSKRHIFCLICYKVLSHCACRGNRRPAPCPYPFGCHIAARSGFLVGNAISWGNGRGKGRWCGVEGALRLPWSGWLNRILRFYHLQFI